MRAFAALLLVLAAGGAYAQQLEPGEWEFVSDIAMPGLPRPQQSGSRSCLTPEQSKDPLQWGRGAQVPSDCRVTTLKLGPDAVSWDMECPVSGMRGAGKARIGRGSVASELQMTGGVRIKTQGRRLGPCKP